MAIDPDKLPSMKRTPPAPEPAAPRTPAADGPGVTPGVAGASPVPTHVVEVGPTSRDLLVTAVIAFVLGLLFLALGQSFVRYLGAAAGGRKFETNVNWTSGDKAGQPVDYWELTGGTAWTDMGLAAMGAALLACGGLALLGLRLGGTGALKLGLVLVGLATLLNLVAGFYVFSLGATPLVMIFAVAVGAVLLVTTWPGRAGRFG